MADEDSPIIEDILLNTGANYFEDNEDGSTNDESKFCFYLRHIRSTFAI
jgi:hypothetical protein